MLDEIKIEFIDGSFRKGEIVETNLTLFGQANWIKIKDKHNNLHNINLSHVVEIVYYNNDIE